MRYNKNQYGDSTRFLNGYPHGYLGRKARHRTAEVYFEEQDPLVHALAALLSSQKEHIVALQHAISQNHVANNVPLPPDLHACNGQAHGDPHAKAK